MKRASKLPTPIKGKMGTYLDLRTDFGFKRIFGTETEKDVLIAFLNDILINRKVITDISFNPNEQTGPLPGSRKMVLDLICTGQNGEQFIIEVQRIYHPNFIDRAVFYSSRLLHDQAPKGGNWDYSLKEVYFIGILDFTLDSSAKDEYLHYIKLAYEKTGNTFYEKLAFIFIEIPKFVKTEDQLQTEMDKWLFILKNLSSLKKLPAILNRRIFGKLFQLAAISNLTKAEFMKYEKDLMAAWDEYSFRKYAREQGYQEGYEEGKTEGEDRGIARGIKKGIEEGIEKGIAEKSYEIVGNMLTAGKFSIKEIAAFAGVSEAFVRKVKKKIS